MYVIIDIEIRNYFTMVIHNPVVEMNFKHGPDFHSTQCVLDSELARPTPLATSDKITRGCSYENRTIASRL